MKKIFIVLSLLFSSITYAASSGIYSLDTVVNKPFVSGVVIRARWSTLEPSEGVYDFSSIEKVVREAVAVGQSVQLTNMVVWEPAWIINKVPASSKYSGIWDTDIVPWDATMQSAVYKLAQAEANFKIDGIALKDHPAIKQLDAPVATANGVRLRTLPSGYTLDKYRTAVLQNMHIWTDAFGPGKDYYGAFFGIAPSKADEVPVRDAWIAEFDGVNNPKVNPFIEYWIDDKPTQASAPHLKAFHDAGFDVRMQACGSWTNKRPCTFPANPDLQKAFDNAFAQFGTTYFEMYAPDLNNSAYQTILQAAADKIKEMTGGTPSPLDCSEQSINWGSLSTVCLGNTPVIKDGMTAIINDTTAPATGSVTANCSAGKVILSNPVCTSTPDPCEPPPPPPPPPVDTVIGYLGCSMTMDAANGASALGSATFWKPTPVYGGGGVGKWATNLTNTNSYWAAFSKSLAAQPTKTIWWELCSVGTDKANETYANAVKVADEIKRRIPGVTIYASAQPAYNPSSHECSIAGIGGQSRMAALTQQLIANGVVLPGPSMGPLAWPSQTIADGCHGNPAGQQLMGKQIIDFFTK